MTSLGRLIFFDQPGTGVSDPVAPGALPTLEQWADSITAVLDDLGSREAALLAALSARCRQRRCSPQHIHLAQPRSSCLRATPIRPDALTGLSNEEWTTTATAMWGTGEIWHLLNPDMPWNEEIRAAWARKNVWRQAPDSCAHDSR